MVIDYIVSIGWFLFLARAIWMARQAYKAKEIEYFVGFLVFCLLFATLFAVYALEIWEAS